MNSIGDDPSHPCCPEACGMTSIATSLAVAVMAKMRKPCGSTLSSLW